MSRSKELYEKALLEYKYSRASLMAKSSAVKIEQKDLQPQDLEISREGMKKAKEGGESSGMAEPSVYT